MFAIVVSCCLLVASAVAQLPMGIVFLSIDVNSGSFPNSLCTLSEAGIHDVCDFQATVPSYQYSSTMVPIIDPSTQQMWIYANEPDYLFGCDQQCPDTCDILSFSSASHPGFCTANFQASSISVTQCVGNDGDSSEVLQFRWAGQPNQFLRVDNIAWTSDVSGNNNSVHFTVVQMNDSMVFNRGAFANAKCDYVAYDYVNSITYCFSGGYLLMFDNTFTLSGRITLPATKNVFSMDYDFTYSRLIFLMQEGNDNSMMQVYSMDNTQNFNNLGSFKSFISGDDQVWSIQLDHVNQQYFWFTGNSACVGNYAQGTSKVVTYGPSINKSATQMAYNYQIMAQ